jgi:hypothetical protein
MAEEISMGTTVGIRKIHQALAGLDPERVVAHLEELREEGGGIVSAAEIVEANRDPGSLLHGYFTWEDSVAAERWRNVEARQLLRAVRYFEGGKDVGRAYEAVRIFADDGSRRRGYMESREVQGDEVLRQQVLKTALRQMVALRRRFGNLAELAGVWESVRGVAESNGLDGLI